MRKYNWNINIIEECESTNSQVKLLKAKGNISDRTALMTYFQQKGRGQGQKVWYGSKGDNLLASFYKTTDLPVEKNFILTIITSLALYRLLKKHNITCKIKWPNDIFFENKKIAGILIENSLMCDRISDTTIGVGLNINEKKFPDWIPNACSMQQVINKSNKPENICRELTKELDVLFDEFEKGKGVELYHNYIDNLFRINHWHLFIKEGVTFNGRIRGVEADGRLVLETDGGRLLHLWFGEIEHVL